MDLCLADLPITLRPFPAALASAEHHFQNFFGRLLRKRTIRQCSMLTNNFHEFCVDGPL
jgi:hypothetical protein